MMRKRENNPDLTGLSRQSVVVHDPPPQWPKKANFYKDSVLV